MKTETTVLRSEGKFRVRYLGGHNLYPKEVQGILYVTSDNVRFESSKFTGRKVKFGFPMKKLKQATVKRVRERELVIYLRYVFCPMSVLDSYKKIVALVYEEEGKLQRPVFHFLDDGKDIRKNRFMELLPSKIKKEIEK